MVGYWRVWFKRDHAEIPEAPKIRACFPVWPMVINDGGTDRIGYLLRSVNQRDRPKATVAAIFKSSATEPGRCSSPGFESRMNHIMPVLYLEFDIRSVATQNSSPLILLLPHDKTLLLLSLDMLRRNKKEKHVRTHGTTACTPCRTTKVKV